jgi:hypothetical protein
MTSPCAHCPELRRLRKVVLHQQRIIEAVRADVAKARLPKAPRQTLQDGTGRPNSLAERVRVRGRGSDGPCTALEGFCE